MNSKVIPLHFNPESLTFLDSDHCIIDYVEGELLGGKKIWAYIKFNPSSYMRYAQKKLRGDNIFLLEFGDLLIGGHGEGPTDEDQAELQQKLAEIDNVTEELKNEIDTFVFGTGTRKIKTE